MDRWADYIYRTLTIIVLIFSGVVTTSAKSTDDDFKIESFRALETDLDARLYAKTDENGRKAALIKIVTKEKGQFRCRRDGNCGLQAGNRRDLALCA